MRIGQLLLLLQSVKLTLSTSVIQFTDFHLDKGYRAFGGDPKRMCHLNGQATKNRTIGDFGNYNCDSPKVYSPFYLLPLMQQFSKKWTQNKDLFPGTCETHPYCGQYDIAPT